jgi:ATP-binding cassette subfamily C protein CydCD
VPIVQEGRRLITGSAERVLSSALLFLGRVGVAGGAWLFLRGAVDMRCLVAGGVAAAAFATRVLLQARMRSRIETTFYRTSVKTLLDRPLWHAKEAEAEALIIGNAETLVRHEVDNVPGIWGDGLAAATFTVVLVVTQPGRALLAGLLVALVGGGVLLVLRGFVQRQAARGWAQFTELLRFLMSSVLGRVELSAHGQRDARLAALELKLRDWRARSFRLDWMTAFVSRGSVGVALLVVLAVFAGSSHSTLETATTALLFLQPFAALVQRTLDATRSRDARRAMAELLVSDAPNVHAGRDACPARPRVIAFEDWAGGYVTGADALVIDKLVVDRDDGVVWLAGANGSGKSTLLRSLVGLLAHARGTITIDGHALGAIDQTDWRRRVAYLPQRPHIPEQGTIRDAFVFLHPTADDRSMRDVLARVGLEVSLDADVNTLSAGQRQRLAIARTLLRDAEVVLLDEPDQNLDRQGAQLLVEIVRELASSRLVIVAAHDPAMLAREGRHLSLDKGRIVKDELRAPASAGTRRSQASA